MERKLLYNPFGQDDLASRRMIKGNTTNLINLNNVKYKWASQMWKIMLQNFWIPEKIDMTMDVPSYASLTDGERHSYDGILSFLVFLDSLQTANLPNIGDYITAPEVSPLIQTQDFQEVIHAKSYAYVIESVIPKERRERIYEFWREDEHLHQRNSYIAGIFQSFVDESNDENFAKVLIANYLLEGLYFYNGFQFFYNLANQGKVPNTADMIRYIQRDELTHTILFEHIIKEIREENPGFFDAIDINGMFREAVDQEIAWSQHIIGDGVLGITPQTIEDYTKYMANMRLKNIGLMPIYPETANPYLHLEKHADEFGEGSIRGNFFEANVTAYGRAETMDWDF